MYCGGNFLRMGRYFLQNATEVKLFYRIHFMFRTFCIYGTLLDVVAIFVCLLAEGDRGINPEKLVEEGAG